MPRFAHFVSCYASPFFLSGVLSLLLNVRQPPHSCLLTHFLRYDLTKRSQLLIAPITFHQSNQLPPPPAIFLFSLRFSTLLRFCFFSSYYGANREKSRGITEQPSQQHHARQEAPGTAETEFERHAASNRLSCSPGLARRALGPTLAADVQTGVWQPDPRKHEGVDFTTV